MSVVNVNLPSRCIKRDGRLVKFDPNKITQAIMKAMKSIGSVDEDAARKITDKVVLKIQQKEISVEEIQDKVEDVLIEYGNPRLVKEYILYRAKKAEVRGFRDFIGIEDDLKFGVNALSLLEKRYLRKIDGKKETPSQMFRRVAKAVSSVEKKYGANPDYWSKVFYSLMSNRIFMPATPILSNAGNKDMNYLFSCYALEVSDSIEQIFQAVKEAAILQKGGGGVGLHLSSLRPSGDSVKTTEGIASGPITFCRVFDVTSDVIKEGGIRRGGNLGLLSVSHPDIVEFVACKSDENTLNNFNISVSVSDEFMRAEEEDAEFSLVNPKDKKIVEKIKARQLFRIIAESAWKNGEPGIIFWDRLQETNPTPSLGPLIVNLCQEQSILNHEACVLGSINLTKFVDDGKIIYSSLRKVTHNAVRFLDDVIDTTDYPLDDIKVIVQGNRKIGLGVMGFADALFMLGIPYDSNEGIKVAEDLMSFIHSESIKASIKLAEERESFPNISISSITPPRRNSSLNTIAPTGSIGIIAETSGGIEPAYAIVYQKANILHNDVFFEINPIFIDVGTKEGWYNQGLINKIIRNNGKVSNIQEVPEKWRKVFVTALEINPEWHVRMQAAYQKNCDAAIAKTCNLPNSATVEDVENIFRLAYKSNLKGITVFRDRSRSKQVLQTLCPECEDGVCNIEDGKEMLNLRD